MVSVWAGFEAGHNICWFDVICNNLLMLCPGVNISWNTWDFSGFRTGVLRDIREMRQSNGLSRSSCSSYRPSSPADQLVLF